METLLLYAVVVSAGLLIGSFLTVVVERVPAGGSVVAPPSRCSTCEHRLGPLDLVPVGSWVVLRGRCRHCGTTIGADALVLELVTVTVFVLMAIKFGWSAPLPAFCILAATLVAQTVIDLRTQRLPREITYVGLALGAPALAIAALVEGEPRRIWMMFLGAAIATALMGVIYLAARGGMGDGDVRLSPLLGLFLGWLNPGIVAPGLFFGFIVGAVFAVALMATSNAGRNTAVPFGPFLAVGTIIAIFAGQPFVDLLLQR